MIRRQLTLAAALLGLALPAFAERIALRPVDQAASDPALVAFRDTLLSAVAARDTEAVVAAACREIFLGANGSGGRDDLRLKLTVPPETLSEEIRDQADALRDAYWSALEETLRGPGYFSDPDSFWAPYHWQFSLPPDMDPDTAHIVDGTGVRMRSGPSKSRGVVANLSYEIVAVPEFDDRLGYQKVRLGDGTEGYVYKTYLVPLQGYRAQLRRGEDGQWRLCQFVKSD